MSLTTYMIATFVCFLVGALFGVTLMTLYRPNEWKDEGADDGRAGQCACGTFTRRKCCACNEPICAACKQEAKRHTDRGEEIAYFCPPCHYTNCQ